MMVEILGNTENEIDWSKLIADLDNKEPTYVGPRHRKQDDIIGIKEIAKKWDDAGYKLLTDGGNVGWDMYLPHNDFDFSIVSVFCDIVQINPINAWISKVKPGHFVPLHWDANDNEEEYNSIENLVRFSCHISPPTFGHIFVLEEDLLCNIPQGTIVKWPARTSWHGSFNIGLKNKYLFNIFGIKK
jgi:hypothetical protein